MPAHRAPPDALQKRLSRLPNPPPGVITVYMGEQKDSKMSKLKRGLSVEDRAIAERLEKLKKYVCSKFKKSTKKSVLINWILKLYVFD